MYASQIRLLELCGVPTKKELGHLGLLSEYPDDMRIRVRAVRKWLDTTTYRALVLTSGIEVDFSTPAPLRAPYGQYLPPHNTITA